MFLNCHTYYSLRYGTLSPQKLVQTAAEMNLKSLVLTDINSASAAFAFVSASRKAGIKPILGIEFRSNEQGEVHTNCAGAKFRYVGIARNREGFKELCALLTQASFNKGGLPEQPPVSKNVIYIYRKLIKPIQQFTTNEYIGVRPEEVNRLYTSDLKAYQEKLVVYSPVTFQSDDEFKAHRILRCIDLNIVIGKLKVSDCAKSSERLFSSSELFERFQNFPQIIRNTQMILEDCEVELESTYLNNRRSFTKDKQSDYTLLCRLAVEGCFQRYGRDHEGALDRTLRELKVIDNMGFSSYFLITWDIIRYARTRGYHHVGRGSGANSIVAYNLMITDVDPLELDLYFERFINPHRSSPPDFDIDFSWDERDDVTAYVFRKYGRQHTALLATYNTYKGKSIVRELGKVLGLPKSDIDLIVDHPLDKEKHHPFAEHIFKYGKMIEGFPNYLSIHAGGIIISEEPISYFTPLQLMPKGFPITHFDMYGAEDLGFHKFDILSQRGLGHIKDAVDLIFKNRGVSVDIHQIERIKRDQKVRQQLHSGQCIGCFYIESPAMRGLLTKLRCDNYVHLIAASSIIRPGVAKSGMMREYIRRFHNPDSYEHIHPVFEKHLGETYGVMVYQEDVMKIIHHFSGLGLDESDVLRKIMTGKKKNSATFERLKQKYFRNCSDRGYPKELTAEVWRQIESFSGYSFCKAHSASFAVESFQSLYLKTYYPLEFMVAVINNFGGFYSTELYVHEARMQGADIEAPCINRSEYLTSIDGITIYIGLVHISDLEKNLAEHIVSERNRNGHFSSLQNFVHRVDVDKNQLEILIRIGAFRFTGLNKYQLMWEKNAVHQPQRKHIGTGSFFEPQKDTFELPVLTEGPFEQAFDELELLGFTLRSPFDLLQTDFRGEIMTRHMSQYVGSTVDMLGYFVTRKNVTTVNRRLMNFGTWIDCEGQFFDTIHFPPCLAEYPFKGKGCYIIRGTIVEDFGFPSLEVEKMDLLPYVKDTRY
ncbi:DNA polymerase III subunit alpha [Portibacter marinus]|uniref:DNA polymerase III subunit alpha n=1 Tax=Portibacter marinus TaxID=2898660 RepID=UPI001F3B4250|nr:DNA polymerase III subunit alpha [Portibacter marinus]